jgi:hypothetical protein
MESQHLAVRNHSRRQTLRYLLFPGEGIETTGSLRQALLRCHHLSWASHFYNFTPLLSGNSMAVNYPVPDQNSIIDLDEWISPENSIYRTVHMHLIDKIKRDVNESLAKVRGTPGVSRLHAQGLGASLRPIDHGIVFFIDGTRGAGKSTFLRAVCQNLCDDLKPHASQVDRANNWISILDRSEPD